MTVPQVGECKGKKQTDELSRKMEGTMKRQAGQSTRDLGKALTKINIAHMEVIKALKEQWHQEAFEIIDDS